MIGKPQTGNLFLTNVMVVTEASASSQQPEKTAKTAPASRSDAYPADAIIREKRMMFDHNKSIQAKPSVLILTGGKGNGHRCPAEAVESAFKDNDDVSLHKIDIKMEGIDRNWRHDMKFKLTNSSGLLNSINHKRSHESRQGLRDQIMDVLADASPDAIYVNYDVLSHQLEKVMRDMELDIPVVGASADHGKIHADWYPKLFTHQDSKNLFLLPSMNRTDKNVKSDALQDALDRNVPVRNLRFEGYPVRPAFIEAAGMTRNECREKMGITLPAGKDKVMLGMVGTGFWTKNFASLIEEAANSAQFADTHIVVIAGSNQKLRDELTSNLGDKIDLRGKCDAHDVAMLMRAADVVATKAGGSSLHECNAVGTPALIYMALSGVESENARHADEQGTGVLALNPDKFVAVASNLLQDPQAREAIASKQKLHFDPHSNQKIANLLIHTAQTNFSNLQESAVQKS